ncbi:MAG: PEP-CTERM sorting domain-containing protein [Oxalobacteraceae bacterium]|nr:MAG: PEP-CTERM sorting domain-containing protein [Oxalobacteraceae bacterium]
MRLSSAALIVSAIVGFGPAQAAIYEVDGRTGFAAPFGFDFSAFGNPGAFVSTQDTRTVNGVTITARTSGGTFNLAQEGSGYTGNFATGTTLLTQPRLSDNFILSFSGMPVYGVGTQFEPFSSSFMGSYTAILEVFDTAGTKIADFTRQGTKTTAEDGSVPFLGALSTDVPIGTIILSVGTLRAPFFQAGDVAADGLTLSTIRVDVPEPASLALLALPMSLVGLVAILRRREGGVA